MKRLRNLLLSLIALIGTSALPQTAVAELRELRVATLRAGDGAASREGKAIADLNEALAREICLRIASRCTLQPLPFAEIIPAVESGRARIGIANVLRTPERDARVLFSQPIWRSSSRLVGSTASIRSFGSEIRLADLRGARLAVEIGTQQYRYLQEVAAAQKLKLIGTNSVEESMALLLQGQADFSLMPVRSAYFLLLDARGDAAFVGPALVDHGLGGSVHVILPKSDGALRQEVDVALDAMRADGTFQRILRRYMPFLAD